MCCRTDEEQKRILSENLKFFIARSGKDQKQIAIDLDINPPTFNQWVKGKAIPTVSVLRKIACYFNVNLTDIVDKKNDQSICKIDSDNYWKSKAMPYINKASAQVIIAYCNASKTEKRMIERALGIVKQGDDIDMGESYHSQNVS